MMINRINGAIQEGQQEEREIISKILKFISKEMYCSSSYCSEIKGSTIFSIFGDLHFIFEAVSVPHILGGC